MTGRLNLPAPALRRQFQRRLLAWHRLHRRDLPWRKTRGPYRILVTFDAEEVGML